MKTISAVLIAASIALLASASACDNGLAPVLPPDLSAQLNPDMALPSADLSPIVTPPDFGCYGMPMTHVQIINACTTADSYDKTPFYPSLAPNGVLPMLQ